MKGCSYINRHTIIQLFTKIPVQPQTNILQSFISFIYSNVRVQLTADDERAHSQLVMKMCSCNSTEFLTHITLNVLGISGSTLSHNKVTLSAHTHISLSKTVYQTLCNGNHAY